MSILIATAGAGRCFGWQPLAKVSMMIMRPPQQRHGRGSTRGPSAAAVSNVSACFGRDGTASNSRALAMLAPPALGACEPENAVRSTRRWRAADSNHRSRLLLNARAVLSGGLTHCGLSQHPSKSEPRFAVLLLPDRTPTPLAGSALVLVVHQKLKPSHPNVGRY